MRAAFLLVLANALDHLTPVSFVPPKLIASSSRTRIVLQLVARKVSQGESRKRSPVRAVLLNSIPACGVSQGESEVASSSRTTE